MQCVEEDSQMVKCEIQGTLQDSKMYFLKNVHTVTDMKLPKQSVDVENLTKNWKYLSEGQPESMNNVERVMGQLNNKDFHDARVMTTIERQDELYEMVKQSFSLESFGTDLPGQGYSRDDKKALEIMKSTTQRTSDGRFETGLLWKEKQPPKVPDSKNMALKRLTFVERKMDKDPQLAAAYCTKMDDHIQKKYLVKITDEEKLLPVENVWYLPHFSVFHPAKGKIRVVFDCAAKSHDVSLNDLLLKGPDLLRSLPAVLENFRRGKFAFMGDIREMFHRVYIRKEDVNYQRILWRGMTRDKPPDEYKMQVMTFGASCSPALAAYVKDVNAKEFQEEFPDAVKGILDYTYCDDYLGTADSIEEAQQRIEDIIYVQHQAGFDVVNWTANDERILDTLQDNMKSLNNKDEPERVLGLWWDSKDDVFTFKTNFHHIPKDMFSSQKVPTIREVLRMIMQELWRHKIIWDEEIPEDVLTNWREFIHELQTIDRVKIPRCYSVNLPHALKIQLHVFGDASSLAYAAVAYLRIESVNGIDVSFVCARSMVAPIKGSTIPRLELQAARLSTRMAVAVKDCLHIKIDEVIYWSDSQTVLKWIRSDSRRYKTFVANRINEIDEKTNIRNWKWVPTKENPADMATRNVKCDFSENSNWFVGPNFLKCDEKDWPIENIINDCENDEEVHMVNMIIDVPEDDLLVPKIERFSRWRRLVRATAQARNCTRYWIKKWRAKKENQDISSDGLPQLE
ncbi:uncharacterized protein LOC129808937, partial [Phlebotomus papatasi]|uniref:uncharacterized protein LOC129808937 n=1 Tax=Phlebotomus papatasi TaxID=29031 RepID=UPI0024838285